MHFLGRKPIAEQTSTSIQTAELLIPEPQKQTFSEDITEEYKALQLKLGIGIIFPSYPLESVLRYLDAKYGCRTNWAWVPVRHTDIITANNFNDVTNRTYTKPIPFPVLKTIDEISTLYPQAQFFISDERQPSDMKDPFLLVTLDKGRTLHVVERWDEPAYR